jgi:phosphonate transport system ATP-binding protein
VSLAASLPGRAAIARSPAEPVLQVADLKKSYDGKTAVLRSVNLVLCRGERVALIGANGSGKSTLLRCCLRLVEPDGGSVRVLGEELTGLARARLRKLRSLVGFVFQKHQLVQRLSVLSNVIHGAQGRMPGPRSWAQSLARDDSRDLALECLERVGLRQLASRRVDELSLGQSQRVAIARCLMQQPKLVFADEPAASLDPRGGEEVMALFAELMTERAASVLFTSHQLDHALIYASRIVGLRNGSVVLDRLPGSTEIAELRRFYD